MYRLNIKALYISEQLAASVKAHGVFEVSLCILQFRCFHIADQTGLPGNSACWGLSLLNLSREKENFMQCKTCFVSSWVFVIQMPKVVLQPACNIDRLKATVTVTRFSVAGLSMNPRCLRHILWLHALAWVKVTQMKPRKSLKARDPASDSPDAASWDVTGGIEPHGVSSVSRPVILASSTSAKFIEETRGFMENLI